MSSTEAPVAWNESERLAALAAYAILDTPPEPAFDDLIKLASQLLDAPIVAVNFIAEGRQWFKSEIGLGVREMPLDDSLCRLAILEQDRFVVRDTRQDARFDCNALVNGDPGLRFYAGELLKTPEGLPLGTLCVLDTKPRPEGLTEHQEFALKTLAKQVLAQLELRKLVHEQQTLLAENVDVLAKKESVEKDLRLAQERSRLATDAADQGLWSWDPRADQVRWENQRPYEILGLPLDHKPVNAAEFLRDFVHPSDAPVFESAVTALVEQNQRLYFQGRLRRPTGEIRWIELFGNGQYTQDGTLFQVIGMMTDITDRKLAEAELFESRERFQTIVSQAATGVVEASLDGAILMANQKFCDMLGYDPWEVIGRNVLDFTAPNAIEPTLAIFNLTDAAADGIVLEKQYVRKDGTFMWSTSSVSILRRAGGEAHGFVAIVVDITGSKKTEDDLRRLAANLSEADQRKTEFLATLAHELRNPLAPIRSGLQVMRMREGNPEAIGKIRDMMDRQVTQIVRLVDDLLDVARISGGKVVLRKESVALRSIMASAVEASMPLIESGRHRFRVELPEESIWLDADATRLVQVLANLLNNAAKYTLPGGRIDVLTHVDGSDVVIEVIDNGIGIPQEALATIFDMFSQVGESLTRSQGGLGIGLSLVKRIVEMHGGGVAATSPGAGKGSTFTVRLPHCPGKVIATELVPAPGRKQEVTGPKKQFRLLIADDNADAAETLSLMLSLNGHVTRVAHDGLQAVGLAKTFLPEVAFLDIGMPGMNGYETAATIRRIPGLEDIVLIAVTGWGSESDRARSRQAGFDHHLTKPVDFITVETILKRQAGLASGGSDRLLQSPQDG